MTMNLNHVCKEVRIPISWGTLAGKLWVPTTPTHEIKSGALALHGWHDNAASFDPLIQYFPRGMTVLALDLPGHGHSDHYSEKVAYHWAGFVADVLEVIRHLAWKRPILIGHSFGGMLATVVAATLQNGISKLILIEAMYSDKNEVTDETFFQYMQHKYELGPHRKLPKDKLYSSKMDVAKSLLRRNQELYNLSSAAVLASRGCKAVDGGFVLTRDKRIDGVKLLYVRISYWNHLFQIIYDRITVPSLLINGQGSRYKFEEWMERDGVKLSPTSRRVSVEGGHMVHMNSPDQVGKIMAEFITQKYTSKL